MSSRPIPWCSISKRLGAAFDCSLYYVRDPEHLVGVMSTNPSYLQSAADGRVKNLRDWGIPLGRRFRALKLWSLLRVEGVSGLQDRLRRDLRTPAGWPNWQDRPRTGASCAGALANRLHPPRAAGAGRG